MIVNAIKITKLIISCHECPQHYTTDVGPTRVASHCRLMGDTGSIIATRDELESANNPEWLIPNQCPKKTFERAIQR